jgi:REP element-mobilizing transposase RayT
MERAWFLTWTTYGSWLPGDRRGFVGRIRKGPGPRRIRNEIGTPYEAACGGLHAASRDRMRGARVQLTPAQAVVVLAQFRATAAARGWELLAAAVMARHVHIVVGVDGNPDPVAILRDLKSYGSRGLSEQFGRPQAGTWWTASGSRRVIRTDRSLESAVRYVRDQDDSYAVWIAPWIAARVAARFDRGPARSEIDFPF